MAVGQQPLSYQWQKNSNNITDGGHYSGCTTTTLTITGADSSDQASYRCVVTNAYGGVISSPATVTTSLPSAPTANAATGVTNTAFTANWSSASGATGYQLDVSTNNAFSSYLSGYQNLDVGNVLSSSVTGLSPATTYYYRVRAYNGGGTSDNSGTISVTTTVSPPPAPTANAATSVTNTAFTANWSSASGATGYQLDVSTNNAFSNYVSGYQNLDVGNVLSSSVTGLSPVTTYYYRVRAYNGVGASGNSGTISVTTTLSPPPAPTANAATGVTNTAFTANWSSASGATGYQLDVSTDNAFGSYVSGYQNLDVGNVVSWSVTGLSPVTTYYYRVRAYNGGGTSGNSGTIGVTTTVNPPAAPVANAASSVSSNSFTANWSSASGATGYRLDVSTNNAFSSFQSGYQNLDVGNVLSLSVTGLSQATTYYYRLRAYNSAGASGNSGTISVTTTVNPPPAPVANAASGVSSSSFTANWSSASGATGYRLDVSTNNAFSSFQSGYQNLDVGNVLSLSVTGLSPATTYYYRVRAYNSAGASGNSGTISVTTTVNPPPAPVANAASGVTSNSFTANWSSASGATGYRLDVSTNNTFSTYVAGYQDLDMGNVTSGSVSGLRASTTYYYRVRAYNGGGTSGNSGTITVTTSSAVILCVGIVNPDFKGGNTGGVGNGWTGYQRAPIPDTTVWSIQTASPPTGGGLQYQQIANSSSTGGGGVRQDVTGCVIGGTYHDFRLDERQLHR